MKKRYFLLFGSSRSDLEQVVAEISRAFDVFFVRRESDFSGVYYDYSGNVADTLRIESNYVEYALQDWQEESFKEHLILITLTNTLGKNVDKENKTLYVKEKLLRLHGISLLRENVYAS